MLSPLEPGTLLNQRYRTIRSLDRALPYRTYLARDEGRFNELCVLAELPLNPAATEAVKATLREGFQAEVNKLYRLQHPQVAGVRSSFEEGERLFLVLTQVEGQTLSELRQARQSRGERFNEAEVRQWLDRLLPVLGYLHRHDIVHGNLSPETIALRGSSGAMGEGEPILTDFGAIADLAHRFQSADGRGLSTVAARIGYAPPEQRQTGQATPSSDLYALAATAVVLLAGKEPEELYDPLALAWQWQPFAKVSPALSAVLERMLQPRPGDRYPTATEALQALASPPVPAAPPPISPSAAPTLPPPQPPVAPPPPPTPAVPPPPPKAPDTDLATVAIGRPLQTAKASPASPSPAQKPPAPQRQVSIPEPKDPLLDNRLLIGALTIFVAIVAALGAWGLVNFLTRPRPTETPSPVPSISAAAESPSPAPTPSPTPSPTPARATETTRRIPLLAGESFVDRSALSGRAIVNYIIPARAEERLQARVRSEGVLLKILQPNGRPVAQEASSVKAWEGTLPVAGDYTVQLFSIPGTQEGDSEYELNLRLETPAAPAPSPSVSPTASPSPSPAPSEAKIESESVAYPPDLAGQPLELTGTTTPETVKRYLVSVEAGQVLQAAVLEGRVSLEIRFPDGRLVEDARAVQLWEGEVLQSGQYQIDVRGERAREFKISVAIRDNAP